MIQVLDIIKIIKFYEESSLLIKVLVKQLKKKHRNKKVDFVECYCVHYLKSFIGECGSSL